MNGKKLSESLAVWLNEVVPAPDVVVVGFQELDLSAETFLLNNSSKARPWEDAISSALNQRDDVEAHAVPGGGGSASKYTHVVSKQLVGILLVVFVKSSLGAHVSVVGTDSAGVGVLGVMGNKGGVAALLRVFDEEWLIVNSHLAAGQGKESRRNQDYAELSRRLNVGGNTLGAGTDVFDAVLWLGDLNYRIDLPNDVVREAVALGDYALLRKSDQLLAAKAAGRAFVGYSEGKLKFIPTYKYDNGTNIFDSSAKNRIPAWTDRVLYKYAHPGAWNLVSYTTTTELLTSDHKPVSAHFVVSVGSFSRDAYSNVRSQVDAAAAAVVAARDVEKPKLDISPKVLELGQLAWGVPVEAELILTNPSSSVPVMYALIRDHESGSPCSPWLALADGLSKATGVLAPGEAISLPLTALLVGPVVAAKSLRGDSSGVARLRTLLQFDVQGNPTSPSIVVPVTADYVPDVFGASLNGTARSQGTDVPPPLWYLLDALSSKHALACPNLFTMASDLERAPASIPGLSRLMDTLRSEPDTLASSSAEPQLLAACLIQLIYSWSTPVIPPDRIPEVLGVAMAPAPAMAATAIIESLSLAHYNVFWYLVAYLNELLAHSHKNQVTHNELLTLFAQVMLREEAVINIWPDRTAAKVRFLSLFVPFPSPREHLFTNNGGRSSQRLADDDDDDDDIDDDDDDEDDLIVNASPSRPPTAAATASASATTSASLLMMSPPSQASPMRRSDPAASTAPPPSSNPKPSQLDLLASLDWS